jgi:hypothetical protein
MWAMRCRQGHRPCPPASAAVVAVVRRHCQVDRVEPLHPCHVGRGGIQYYSLLSPPPSPRHPVSVSAGFSVPALQPRCPALPDPPSSKSIPPNLPCPSSLPHGNGNNLRARSILPMVDVVASLALSRAIYLCKLLAGVHLQPCAAGGPWGSG